MNFRKSKLLLLTTLLATSVNLFASINGKGSSNNPHSEKPNIIFILTDDQRWDALGYAGNKIIQTPEMDKLAQNGVYFKNTIVTTPICAASRASIFSGVHERSHRYTFQTSSILEQYMASSYPKVLRDAGYYTGFYGKFGVNYPNKEQLFDEYEDYDRNNRYKDYRGYYYKKLNGDTVHLTRYTGQKAIDFIENASTEAPFCLSLSFSAPHAHDGAKKQYFWQEQPGTLYNNMQMPGPALADDKYFERLPKPVQDGFNRLRWTWRYDTPEKYQHSVKGYYRMIKGVDLEIAKIRAKLEEKGIAQNTVIILMGDNGYFLGERQMAGKWLMYDNSIRVPLIIFDPRVSEHKDIEEMALNIDVPATIAEYAGVNQPENWQGKSLAEIASGKHNSIGRDTILVEHLWEFKHIPPSEAVRTNEWKYLRYINDKRSEELYNLKKDPKETKNLASSKKYRKILTQLQAKCDELGERYSDNNSKAPYGLSIEFIREPEMVSILDKTPEFSWLVPAAAFEQKAYQILVSSSMELAAKNIGDVWNSGYVSSSNSNNINFEGNGLKSNTRYFWKVRIYDQANRLSDYSETQSFKTGELGESLISKNFFTVEYIAPSKFTKTGNGSYFVDFGKAAFATLNLKYKPTKASTLTIRLGEKLKEGKVDMNPGGTIRAQEVTLDVTPDKSFYQIELVPDERNTKNIAVSMPDSFPVILPYRYAEIEGLIDELAPEQVIQEAYFNYFDYSTSTFESNNDILNQVWDLCKYSIKATTFAGYYVDGDRERIPYEADAYLNQLSHYCVDNEYAIGRKTIEYFFDSKPTWPTEWQLHVAMLMYQDYLYTGNTELIERFYERLKHKTLMALEVEDGFISTKNPNHNGELMAQLGFPDTTKRLRDIVDWPPKAKNFGGKKGFQMGERDGYVFKRINTVVNGFYYHNMHIMAEFANILNKPDEALDYEYRAAKLKRSINEKLYDEANGYYVDGIGTDHASLHANMILLAFDIVPESRKQSVVDHIKTRGMACSVYGAQYLLESLYKAGEDKYALDLMTATHDRSWYNMIKIGSTITLEAWDIKYKRNLDWNHAWGAVPANIIPRYMWGIQPKVPGFKVAKIKPQMADLKNSSIVYPTQLGQINASFNRISKRLSEYTIEIPANMVAELELKVSPSEIVTVNDEPVNLGFGSIRLNSGKHHIRVKINSF